VIDVTVVAAFELDDELAARRAACEPERAHHGLGAGRDEAHLLDAGIELDDLLGQLDLRPAGRAIGRALAHGRLDRLDDRGVRVAEDQRAPGADEVEIVAAVDVGDLRAARARDHERLAADCAEGAHGRVDTAGLHAAGACEPVA
jgi:hypothetical protein